MIQGLYENHLDSSGQVKGRVSVFELLVIFLNVIKMIRIGDEIVKGTGLSQKGQFVCQFQPFPLKVGMCKSSFDKTTQIKNKLK